MAGCAPTCWRRCRAVLHGYARPGRPWRNTGIDASSLATPSGSTARHPNSDQEEINRAGDNVNTLLVVGHEPTTSALARSWPASWVLTLLSRKRIRRSSTLGSPCYASPDTGQTSRVPRWSSASRATRCFAPQLSAAYLAPNPRGACSCPDTPLASAVHRALLTPTPPASSARALVASAGSISLIARPQASIPGAWGLTHQPTTPRRVAGDAAGAVGIRPASQSSPRPDASDLVLRPSATLRSLPRDCPARTRTGDIGSHRPGYCLPPADRADERSGSSDRYRRSSDVGGQGPTFLSRLG